MAGSEVARIAAAALALVWAGMVIGVSGLATPLKFRAEQLDLAAALEVGTVTFAFFAKVELACAVLLAVTVWAGSPGPRWRLVALCIGAIVLVQGFALLPQLSARSAMVAGGVKPDPAPWHVAYVALEAIKLVLLLLVGVALLRRFDGQRGARYTGHGAGRRP